MTKPAGKHTGSTRIGLDGPEVPRQGSPTVLDRQPTHPVGDRPPYALQGRVVVGVEPTHRPEKFTYAPAVIGEAHGRPLAEWPVREWLRRLKRPRRGQHPDMQMNPYDVNDPLSLLQARGVTQMHTELTSHGGKLGVFLYFRLRNPSEREA